MRRFMLGLLLVWGIGLAGCGAGDATPGGAGTEAGPVTLTVFAAASLTDAFMEMGHAFQARHPNVEFSFNFGASNQLAQQLAAGAPADVFASANEAQMAVAVEAGRVADGSQQTFARNRLVVIFPADNPANIQLLHDLARPGLLLVLAAAEVPVGQYSLDFLDKAAQEPAFGAAFKDGVLANVVSYEENVRAVLSKVALGEADAGIVYSSDITSGAAADVGRLDIPDDLNTIATYPIAPISDSQQLELAAAFVEFVRSAEGQGILGDYGFIPADNGR